MPNVPNLVERLALSTNQFPGVIVDLLGAVAFRVLGAAFELGIFEALEEEPRTTSELAGRLGCSEVGLARILEILEGSGYVSERRGRYANTALTRRWLLRSSPQSVRDAMVVWGQSLFDLWDDLETSLRTGSPAVPFHEWLSRWPGGEPLFASAMRAAAARAADEVAKRSRLPRTARRLLDVGGSHGLYSAAFCRRHPALSATVFDLPDALDAARATIAAEGLEQRMKTRAGDLNQADFGEGWDAVLLFNVVHYFDAATNASLLKRAAAALRPGGVLVVMEQLADMPPIPTARAFVRFLSLQYFHTLGSRVYHSDEIRSWLQGAGFGPPRRVGLRTLPGVYLLVAPRHG